MQAEKAAPPISSLRSRPLFHVQPIRSAETPTMHCRFQKDKANLSPSHLPSLLIIKFLHNQMQEQIDIYPQRTLKEVHKLCIVELRLQQIVQRDLRTGPGNHHVPCATLNGEDANLIARY